MKRYSVGAEQATMTTPQKPINGSASKWLHWSSFGSVYLCALYDIGRSRRAFALGFEI